jgi:hypothetical protein
VALDPDEGRSASDPLLVSHWWHEHQGEFGPRTRYLNGQPVTPEALKQLLNAGLQKQRFAAAELLALGGWVRPLFDVHAPAFRQHERLGEIW